MHSSAVQLSALSTKTAHANGLTNRTAAGIPTLNRSKAVYLIHSKGRQSNGTSGATSIRWDQSGLGIEKRGKSFVIAKSEQSKLDDFYNKKIERIAKGLPAAGNNPLRFKAGSTGNQSAKGSQTSQKQTEHTGRQSKNTKTPELQQSSGRDTPAQNNADIETPEALYFVSEKKTSSSYYGESTQVKLVDMNDGKLIEAFVKGQATNLSEGVKLLNVKVSLKN